MKTQTMNNGLAIPSLGFGTFNAPDEEAYASVLEAIRVGYRHIDTAALYKNEAAVGRAIKDSGVPREELFITTKLWNDAHGYEEAKTAFQESLDKLGLDYLDLYLIHWPNPVAIRDHWQRANQEAWRAMEDLVAEGKIRSIGVSNFLVHHLESLLETARIRPVVNQLRLAPGVYQKEIVDYCREQDILLEAWSPLGRGELFSHPVMLELAGKYQVTVAQLALAWAWEEGFIPLPKSVTPSRIRENFEIPSLAWTPDDIQRIRDIDGVTGAYDPDTVEF